MSWRWHKRVSCLVVSMGFVLAVSMVNSRVTSAAKVTVSKLEPPSGSKVGKHTKIRATLEYAIEPFQSKGTRYILAPYFDVAGEGQVSFNEMNSFMDARILTKPAGSVHISYSIAREWVSGKLAKPIKVHFRILMLTGPHQADSVAEAETITYEVE